MPAASQTVPVAAEAAVPPRHPEHLHLVRQQPSTTVIAGCMPDPLLSSRARGWNGVTVELQSFQDIDVVVQAPDHVVAVHVGGSVKLRRTLDGQTRVRTMSAGDIAITPVGPPVRWQQTGRSLVILLRIACAYVRTVAVSECAMDPGRVELQGVFGTRDDVIDGLARRLLAAFELEGADSHLHVDTLACDLAIHLLRRYTTAVVDEWPRPRLAPHKLRRAMQYIDGNLRGQLTLSALADAVALSPGHFAHAFREATGVAPHRYVLERRVALAKELLRQSDLPITEIADRIGCSSHSHFSVMFHRVTGLTPRQFRALE